MRNDAICKVLETITDDLHLRCCIDQWYAPHKICVMNDLNQIYNKINEISRLTDSLRYSLEPWSHAGLRGTRGRCPGECIIDHYDLVLEDLDNIEHDILCIRSYLKKVR